jgi:LPS export ABC transporter protein LptC
MKWSIAFALIGVVTLLAVFVRVDSESPTSSAPQALVEVEIDQLVLTRYDSEGNKLEQSSATHAIRLENQSTTELSKLEVRRRDRQGQEWILASPSGSSDASNDTLKLEGGVVVSRADGVNLLTKTVVVDIAAGRAISADKTQLTSNQSVSASDGLVIDLEQGTAELLGKVRSTYHRSQQTP